MSIEAIAKMKGEHREKMEGYALEVSAHMDGFGEKHCDKLSILRNMESYHRGAWNALNQAEKALTNEIKPAYKGMNK